MYVIINGVSSDTIQGLQVLSLPPITKPKMRRQVDTIDGRAGDIITELGYEAYDRTITVLLHHTYDLDAITAFFNTSGEIIFSNEPDKKYYFRLLEKIDYERAVQFKTANITFHVQPYKYPVNETPLTVSTTAWEGTDYDQTPYIFRAVSDSSVEVGNREVIEQITGGTVAWNQLVSSSATSVTITSGHKYVLYSGSTWSIGASTGSAITVSGSGGAKLFDLTQMFGTTIADYEYNQGSANCIAWFRGLFQNATTAAYNAGTLMSVKTSAHETVGKNLLNVTDVTVSSLTFNVDSDGYVTASPSNTDPRAWSYANCQWYATLPKGTYYLDFWCSKVSASTNRDIKIIIPEGTSIGSAYNYGESGSISFTLSSATTIGVMTKLYESSIRMQIRSADAPTGYVPYQKHTYQLSNIELRGIPKLVNNKLKYDGDIYKADGSVTRRYGYAVLDGSSDETWGVNTSYGRRFYLRPTPWNQSMVGFVSNNTVITTAFSNICITSAFKTQDDSTYAKSPTYPCMGFWSDGAPVIRVEALGSETITTVGAFRTWLSAHPIYLVYELATSTTETTTPYTETQICDADGTEEFIDTRDVQIPVGHKTKYKQINDPAEITVLNAGNVLAAPTIQLTGSGTVGVYLGNAQTLQVNIPEDGITIDTEAQDATSNGQLANRSVTGDYDSVRLQPGDNDVSFSGNFSAVITKYTRWV